MKKLMLLGSVLLLFSSCNAQDHNTEKSNNQQSPKGNWNVHKEYDEQGNLVRMDSTYSYSSINGKEVSRKEMDSIMNAMHQRMQMSFGNSMGQNFFLPENEASDSISRPFFSQGFDDDFVKMQQQMMQQMQAFQQQFMQQEPLIPREEEPQKNASSSTKAVPSGKI